MVVFAINLLEQTVPEPRLVSERHPFSSARARELFLRRFRSSGR
jgi:hypothetical protein